MIVIVNSDCMFMNCKLQDLQELNLSRTIIFMYHSGGIQATGPHQLNSMPWSTSYSDLGHQIKMLACYSDTSIPSNECTSELKHFTKVGNFK